MEKEKLKDKLPNLSNLLENFSIDKAMLLLVFAFDMIMPKITILILLLVLFFLSKNLYLLENNSKYFGIISLLYLIVPTFLHINILDMGLKKDFILWIFLLLFSVKISIYLFNNVLDEITDTKKYALFGLIGSTFVSILIGIIAALFLKQKIISFVILNVILSFFIYIQYIINNRINNYLKNSNKYIVTLVNLHNNFIFIFLITTIYLLIR